ncbi:MAG: type II toxin-antitoxin system HicB family antitoxin [Symplocastrum torsivum CPER-KK1]|jgi:predicted RNase H-like HicB family nuclease|uniref:Type II toxin-antitoxin system HicB family antitoxin n=1 Tax=Symplocastrum torsivum CPER-KK1 TaxID=450513 RepID=A0A951UA00_9CYAN|nr:type II toxin-antitoxin system HicB family antitoxin [Symplocastrum torsivum CPER-KK1]
MIQEYLQKAMEAAHYELLENNEGFYGEIRSVSGVWATGITLEACRKELLEVLEEWVVVGIAMGHDLPEFNGVTIQVKSVA